MKVSRLKEIIREEVRNVINEGTRWLVGIEEPSGKITSTYGHYDGYPEWAGKHLKKYYRNPAVVKQFIKERLPRGFLGKGDELIPMIQLLCSDDASMMAGCLVPIDAGECPREIRCKYRPNETPFTLKNVIKSIKDSLK